MAGRVRSIDDIFGALETVPPEGRIFCFFAFDDRPSHKVVLDFLADSIRWIDSLSASAGVFSLIFSEKWEPRRGDLWLLEQRTLVDIANQRLCNLLGQTLYSNPSLELAKRFGLKPRDLPGLIVFDSLSTASDIHSVFVPLDLAFFTGLPELRERYLAELFSRIQEVCERHADKDNTGGNREKLFSNILRSLSTVNQNTKPLHTFQEDIVKIIAEILNYAFAKPFNTKPSDQNMDGTPICTILFLSSNPKDTIPLRLDEEIRAIDQALLRSEHRDSFDLKQQWAVRVSDFLGSILRHNPDIVHFSGHGSSTSEIILQDDYGVSRLVSVRALGQLFSKLRGNIKCVVLNTCYSEPQARSIAEHMDCVIGMSKAIGDEAAINFATAFYQALGYGKDVKTAFDLGCLQIDLEGLDEQDTPKLLALRGDPREFIFVQNH